MKYLKKLDTHFITKIIYQYKSFYKWLCQASFLRGTNFNLKTNVYSTVRSYIPLIEQNIAAYISKQENMIFCTELGRLEITME